MPIARKSWTVRDKLDRQDSATRARLLTAARTVFEQRGYARTTIADITAESDVGRATFYVYFASKQDVFAVLAADLRDRFLAAQEAAAPEAEDPYLLAERTNAAFLDAYVDNLAFLTVLEHQSLTDPAMRVLRDEINDRPAGAPRATSPVWCARASPSRPVRRSPWPPPRPAWSRASHEPWPPTRATGTGPSPI